MLLPLLRLLTLDIDGKDGLHWQSSPEVRYGAKTHNIITSLLRAVKVTKL